MSDLINRQDAIEAIRNIKAITGTFDDEILLIDKAQAQTELMMLPSAEPEKVLVAEVTLTKDQIQDAVDKAVEKIRTEMEWPERKKGKWIDIGSGQECSECHEIQYGYDSFRYFCAFCGADMREGEQDG